MSDVKLFTVLQIGKYGPCSKMLSMYEMRLLHSFLMPWELCQICFMFQTAISSCFFIARCCTAKFAFLLFAF